ncbi:MAG: acyl-CoA-binding protein [Bdellovibrio sp.]|nr:acyl-CoA-binding protein [Bdellovibrio sp.]
MATDKFKASQDEVKKLKARPTNEELLDLYALYKQGMEGNVKGDRPGMFNLKERAKYDCWATKKDMKSEDAQTKYVQLVETLIKKYGKS